MQFIKANVKKIRENSKDKNCAKEKIRPIQQFVVILENSYLADARIAPNRSDY